MNLATCVVSCDSGYLREFFPSFATSCGIAGNPLHCHIINASEEDLTFALNLADKLKNIKVGITFERGSPEDRVYYACNRFLIAPTLLETYPNGMMICDIDSIIMKPIPTYHEDVGLYFREPLHNVNAWESEGTHIAAGAVYMNGSAKPFAEKVYEILLSGDGNLYWFSDQVALHRAYSEYKDSLKFLDLSQGFMSWESSENCYLFSAKGNRKYTMEEYVLLKSEMESEAQK